MTTEKRGHVTVAELHDAARMTDRLNGNQSAAAKALGIPRTTLQHRLAMWERFQPKGRRQVEITDELRNGVVFIASDAHYWPGEPSTAHRAFVHLAKKLKPQIVVMNGDVLDMSGISRHPPIGWDDYPTVKDELDVAKERLKEIEKASPKAIRYWPLGNHDARFETRLAQVAPEFKDIHGIHLKDHFEGWEPCWSLFLGGERGAVIKHRFKGGIHATHNNTMWAGRTMITGHLHSQKITPFTDYNGTRYGVDTGCLADPFHPAFQGYTEDNPRNWRSGFCVLTFHEGTLLMPELVSVIEPGAVQFRGEVIEV